jgi:hypothetical protein
MELHWTMMAPDIEIESGIRDRQDFERIETAGEE